MSPPDPLLRDVLSDLADFLDALRGYLDRVVICGGWVPYFYRHLPLVTRPPHGPLMTHDFDLAAPTELPTRSEGSLHDCLLAAEHAEGPVSAEQVFKRTADAHLVNATSVFRTVGPFLEEVFATG